MAISTIGQNGLTNPLPSLASNTIASGTGSALTFQTNGSTTAMTIDTSQRVSIGGTTVTDYHLLNIQGPTTTNNVGVVLNDTTNSKIYAIDNGGTALKFFDYTANTERMRIDTYGNVGIGTSSPSSFVSNGGLCVYGSAANSNAVVVNNTVGDWAFKKVRSDNSNAMGIYDPSGYGQMALYAAGSERMRIDSSGNVTIKTADAGIVFNKSGALNNATLNDYETGTWTPQIQFSGTISSGATYSSQVGYYTKIGNTVQVQCLLTWTAKGSGTGNFGITGFPFATGGYCGMSFSPTGLSYTGIPTAQLDSGSVNCFFYQMNTSGTKSNLTNTGVGATGEIIMNAVYHV